MERSAVVIGAGVVGLACAAELARAGWQVLLLEREETYGRGASSRNSEVIHAGLYYAAGSLKATLCVEGRERLYRYLAERDLPHRRCGKIIVATLPGELAALDELERRALANGVDDLRWVEGHAVAALEPSVRALAALHSPSTGILDVHALMHALAADLQRAGGSLVCGVAVEGAEPAAEGWRLRVREAGGEQTDLEAQLVVNSAGLFADEVARTAAPLADADLPRLEWSKGNYFSVRPGARVRASRLIYPVPAPQLKGLGVHLTLDLGGGMRLGPDVEALPARREEYSVDAGRAAAFLAAAQSYLPALEADDLAPAYAGIRAQRAASGGFRDFYIAHEAARGAPGWINLIGIESPGLTASLAIATHVAALAQDAAPL